SEKNSHSAALRRRVSCRLQSPPSEQYRCGNDADDRSGDRAAGRGRHGHGDDPDSGDRRQPIGCGRRDLDRDGDEEGHEDHQAAREGEEHKKIAARGPRSAVRENMNYERFLERDVKGIREVIREFRSDHTSDELFREIARFAVLAYAPSQHAKHAVIACLSAYELRYHPSYDELLTECAIYAASSRAPWSEPPMTDPPKAEPPEDASPRQRAEYRLPQAYKQPDFAHEYFSAAAKDFEDFGHKLIVAVTAWKLAAIFGEQGRYATLRMGVWEMTAYEGRYEERGNALETEPLLARLIDDLDAND